MKPLALLLGFHLLGQQTYTPVQWQQFAPPQDKIEAVYSAGIVSESIGYGLRRNKTWERDEKTGVTKWAIAYVSDTDTNDAGTDMTAVSSLTFSVTLSDIDRGFLALFGGAIDTNGGGIGVASATYNGNSFTILRNDEGSSGGTEPRTDLLYLVNPRETTADVVVTLNGANTIAVAAVTYFSGVDQTAPMDDVGGEGSTDTLGGTVSDTVEAPTDGAYYAYCIASKILGTPVTAGGETETSKFQINGTDDIDWVAGYKAAASVGTQTVTYTGFGVDDACISLMSIRPSGGLFAGTFYGATLYST